MTSVMSDKMINDAQQEEAFIQSTLLGLRNAQKKWAQVPLVLRVAKCRKMKYFLSQNAEHFAQVIAEENGKTKLEALSQEIIPTLDTLDFLFKSAEDLLKPKLSKLQTKQFYFQGKQNSIRYQPYGVIGILGTWNYAFFLSFTQAIFALVAGNSVFLKSSELSPCVNQLILDLLSAGEIDPELFCCAAKGVTFGELLIVSGCDKYILTGAKSTGKKVLKTLAHTLTPSVMELSGCDPYIIFPDGDFDLAIRSLIWATYQYSGQTCVAPRRLIIQKQDKEKFLRVFKQHFEQCREFIDSQTELRTRGQNVHEHDKINALLEQGGKVLFGSYTSEAKLNQFSPILLEGVSNQTLVSMDFMAPVLFLIEGEDIKSMIELASDSHSALGASVWTRNERFAMDAATQICAGQIWINDAFFSVAVGSVAFGGFKSSGFGKTRGASGLLEMVQEKFVSYDSRHKRMTPHLPPYPARSFETLNGIQRILFSDGWLNKCKAITGFMIQLTKRSTKS